MRMSIPIMGTSSFLGKLGFWCLRQVAFQVQPLSNSSQNFQCWCVKGAVGFLSRLFQVGKSYFDPELVTLSWEEQVPLEPIIGQVFQVSPLFNSSQKRVVQPFPSQKILLDLETSQASIGKNRFQQNWDVELASYFGTRCGTTRLPPIGRNGLWELIFPGLVVWGFGDQRLHDPQFQNVRGYAYSSNSALPPRALHAIKHATNQVGCFI